MHLFLEKGEEKKSDKTMNLFLSGYSYCINPRVSGLQREGKSSCGY